MKLNTDPRSPLYPEDLGFVPQCLKCSRAARRGSRLCVICEYRLEEYKAGDL